MAKDMNGTEVNEGDIVTIKAMGFTKTGKVVYSDYYDGVWDIEMVSTSEVPNTEYAHWRQYFDKGDLVKVNGKEVIGRNRGIEGGTVYDFI